MVVLKGSLVVLSSSGAIRDGFEVVPDGSVVIVKDSGVGSH